ncbi:hypothetical protein ACWCXC_19730 [Streptomyces sp. NPDC001515]
MAVSQAIAASYAPPSGVEHVNVRHTERFTVVGNHLSQHPDLSLAARGLALHIQSLPPGAKIGIKALAARLPADSEHRIAGALRELERHGYLRRTRERRPDGRVFTRTVSYNHPGGRSGAGAGSAHDPAAREKARTRRAARPVSVPASAPAAVSVPAPVSVSLPAPVPPPPPIVTTPATPPTPPTPPAPPTRLERPSRPTPSPSAPTARPLPQPSDPSTPLLEAAGALLAGLRRDVPQLTLTEGDIASLAPAVVAWFEREASGQDVRRALTSDLPVPVRYPGKLVRHRLTALLPSPLPAGSGGGAPGFVPKRTRAVVPMQNCDGCERAFRAAEPGSCRDCREEAARGAT